MVTHGKWVFSCSFRRNGELKVSGISPLAHRLVRPRMIPFALTA